MSAQARDDYTQLQPIFQQPESIVALERFNEIIHCPSETIINSLINLFNNALNQTPSSGLLHQDPLFITILINRLISQALPTRSQLTSTFTEFLSIIIHLEFNCPFHPEFFERIKKQLILSMTKLAIRMISSYHCNVDPISELISPLRHLAGLDLTQYNHPHQEATSACLAVIKNVLSFFDRTDSVNSNSLCKKITKNHFETLYEIYNQLVVTSHQPEKYHEYQRIGRSINLLLKIFKLMIKPLTTLSSSTSPMELEKSKPQKDASWVLNWFSKSLIKDFQTYLNSEMSRMDNNDCTNLNHVYESSNPLSSQFYTPQLETFSSHICQYGDIMLQIQSCQPSIITLEALIVYLKIIEYVSTQLVFIHNSINQVENSTSVGTYFNLDSSLSLETKNPKKLIKFYPILNQALKLLNNSLNPWNSNDSFNNFNNNLSVNLSQIEIIKLIELLQPLLNFRLGLESYLDGRNQQVSDDSESNEDSSNEQTETSTEMEDDIEEDNQSVQDWENECIEEDSNLNNQNHFFNQQNLSHENNLNKKNDNFVGQLNLTFSALNSSINHTSHNFNLTKKEPLQIEIEDLIKNLKLIHQKN